MQPGTQGPPGVGQDRQARARAGTAELDAGQDRWDHWMRARIAKSIEAMIREATSAML